MNLRLLLIFMIATFVMMATFVANMYIMNTQPIHSVSKNKTGEKNHERAKGSKDEEERPMSALNLSELLRTSNSSHYTWVGNHFIPPKNVPTFTPQDYTNYFKNRNTLFIGDSTGRRAYASLYAIMDSKTKFDIPLVELDHSNVIDFNRGHNRKEHCENTDRGLFNKTFAYNYVCRNIVLESEENETSTGIFDYYHVNCFKDLPYEFNSTLFRDYDLIVIASGIHEVVRSYDCEIVVNYTETNQLVSLPMKEKLEMVYGSFANASSSRLQFVFRTPGFDKSGHGDDIMWEIINHIKEYSSYSTRNTKSVNQYQSNNNITFFHPQDDNSNPHHFDGIKSKNYNITVVDWGTIISKRSRGDLRIDGDIKAHYGFEARLLFSQQLLHELIAADAKQ